MTSKTPIADALCENFRILIDKYDSGELNNLIKDREDLVRINRVYANVDLFRLFAIEKNEWYKNVNNGDLDWDIDMHRYEEWRSWLIFHLSPFVIA
jgi:hypothetical protein